VDGEVVRVNGVELFTRRFGDPSLPVLVVIHGGPTWDHSYLLPAVAELADVAHVVLFDLRGCGRSSRRPPVGTRPVAALQPDQLAAVARPDATAALRGMRDGTARSGQSALAGGTPRLLQPIFAVGCGCCRNQSQARLAPAVHYLGDSAGHLS